MALAALVPAKDDAVAPAPAPSGGDRCELRALGDLGERGLRMLSSSSLPLRTQWRRTLLRIREPTHPKKLTR